MGIYLNHARWQFPKPTGHRGDLFRSPKNKATTSKIVGAGGAGKDWP